MGDLSDHVSRKEVSCKCGCGFDAADAELLAVIERMMNHFQTLHSRKLTIRFNSWNRCNNYNRRIDGAADGSKHTKGIACDFVVEAVPADDVATYLENTYPDTYGIGRYLGRTHLDVRQKPARWDSRG